VPPHVIPDVVRETVTGNPDGLIAYNFRRAHHCNLTGTTADINDHISHWFFHINAIPMAAAMGS